MTACRRSRSRQWGTPALRADAEMISPAVRQYRTFPAPSPEGGRQPGSRRGEAAVSRKGSGDAVSFMHRAKSSGPAMRNQLGAPSQNGPGLVAVAKHGDESAARIIKQRRYSCQRHGCPQLRSRLGVFGQPTISQADAAAGTAAASSFVAASRAHRPQDLESSPSPDEYICSKPIR